MVTTTSPEEWATPALRTAAMFRASESTTTAPAAAAIDAVASVQRFVTTTISTSAPSTRAADRIEVTALGSRTSSLCAGTTTEQRTDRRYGTEPSSGSGRRISTSEAPVL